MYFRGNRRLVQSQISRARARVAEAKKELEHGNRSAALELFRSALLAANESFAEGSRELAAEISSAIAELSR